MRQFRVQRGCKANAMFGQVEEEDYSTKVKKMRVSLNQRQSVMLRNLEQLRVVQVSARGGG